MTRAHWLLALGAVLALASAALWLAPVFVPTLSFDVGIFNVVFALFLLALPAALAGLVLIAMQGPGGGALGVRRAAWVLAVPALLLNVNVALFGGYMMAGAGLLYLAAFFLLRVRQARPA